MDEWYLWNPWKFSHHSCNKKSFFYCVFVVGLMMQVDTVLVCAQPKHIAVAIEGARVIPVQLTDQVGIVLVS